MVEAGDNIWIDCFDGQAFLKTLIDPPPPSQLSLIEPITFKSKPPDQTDEKFIAFLNGKKVYFTPDEVNEHLIKF